MEYPYMLMLLQEVLAIALLAVGLWIRLGRHNLFPSGHRPVKANAARELNPASRLAAWGFMLCSAANLLLPLLYFWQGNWGSVIGFFTGIGATALFLLLLLTVFEPHQASRHRRRRQGSADTAQTEPES
ncbi:MAG: hypothetical protein PHP39_05965 [Oscillospiraceae bacterium]|nr:hypothetical protein [Oscillospiraceae bacterium]